jgi:hypothetical protein
MARLVETFIVIGDCYDANRARQRHFEILRTRVAPLVADLQARGLIGWFSFHVHDRKTGRIPVPEGDSRLFIHLRFERLPRISFERLQAALPEFCQHTRRIRANVVHSLGEAHVSALIAPEIATGWALFGWSSEWVLRFVCSHRENNPVPGENVRQFFHYIENQLLARTAGCVVQVD